MVLIARRQILSAALPLIFCLSVLTAGCGQNEPVAKQFVPRNCSDELAAVKARCGTIEVYENRQSRTGRTIALNTIVVPAKSPSPDSVPLFFLAGGPGQAATDLLGFFINSFDSARESKDFVFVDVRGTGQSNPLNCAPPGDKKTLQPYFEVLTHPSHGTTCLIQLEQRADLSRYTTSINAADLEDVRVALGYSKIDLYGTSYGTRLAQVMMRERPATIRAAVLSGVAPMDLHSSAGYAQKMDRAVDRIFQRCAADEACAARYPNVREELAAVLNQLDQAPVKVTLKNPMTGADESVSFSRDSFAQALRFMIYSPQGVAALPAMIDLAAHGAFESAALTRFRVGFGIYQQVSLGMFYSVTCSEDIPFVDLTREIADSAGTILGNGRIGNHVEICRNWPKQPIPDGFHDPVHTDHPVLVLAGELDPVTEVADAQRVADAFPNALLVERVNSGHSIGYGMECIGPIIFEFLNKASVEGLDTACAQNIPAVPFVMAAQ